MISLRLAKQKARKTVQPSTISEDRPRYPYGTAISLETDTLSKLGQGVEDYSMSGKVSIHGIAKVTGLSKRENEGDGRARQTVDLQLTHLDVTKGKTLLRDLRKKIGNPCPKSRK